MSEPKQIDSDSIRTTRDSHIGRLLLRAARAYNNYAAQKLRERGYAGLGLAHISLIPYIDLDGTRSSVLAERAGITKQAVGQLIDDLAAQGYVIRTVDAQDKRAMLITFTEKGWQFLNDASILKREIELAYATQVGDDSMHTLKTLLATFLTFIEAEDPPSNESSTIT